MIRTLLIPEQQNISIVVPKKYVGKKIEVMLYAVDELTKDEKSSASNNAAQYKGIFTKEEGEKFNAYLKQARNEWDRNI